jgi:hypothetical protein
MQASVSLCTKQNTQRPNIRCCVPMVTPRCRIEFRSDPTPDYRRVWPMVPSQVLCLTFVLTAFYADEASSVEGSPAVLRNSFKDRSYDEIQAGNPLISSMSRQIQRYRGDKAASCHMLADMPLRRTAPGLLTPSSICPDKSTLTISITDSHHREHPSCSPRKSPSSCIAGRYPLRKKGVRPTLQD